MLLKNFYKVVGALTCLQSANNGYTVRNLNGSNTNIINTGSQSTLESNMATFAITSNNSGIHIGSGTTAPTLDDYRIENRIDNNNFSGSVSRTTTYTDNGIKITSTCTLTNISTTSFTIGEIGLALYTKGSNTSYVLVERSLLETPITLQPNEVAQFTYSIEFNY